MLASYASLLLAVYRSSPYLSMFMLHDMLASRITDVQMVDCDAVHGPLPRKAYRAPNAP